MTAGRDAAKIATENSSLRCALESMRDRADILESQLVQVELDNITLREEQERAQLVSAARIAELEQEVGDLAAGRAEKDARISSLEEQLAAARSKLAELDAATVSTLRGRLRAKSETLRKVRSELYALRALQASAL